MKGRSYIGLVIIILVNGTCIVLFHEGLYLVLYGTPPPPPTIMKGVGDVFSALVLFRLHISDPFLFIFHILLKYLFRNRSSNV